MKNVQGMFMLLKQNKMKYAGRLRITRIGGDEMAEYIDRQELLSVMERASNWYTPNTKLGKSMRLGVELVRRLVNKQPVVDAVEVVRCEECKHRGGDICPMLQIIYDPEEDEYTWEEFTESECFCYFGEKTNKESE